MSTVANDPATPAGAPAPLRRGRRGERAVTVVVLFAALLFVFPSEVALAGPLRSNGAPARLLGMLAVVLLLLDLLRGRRERRAVAPPIVVLLLVYLAQAIFFYGWTTLSGTDDPAGLLRQLLFSASACGIGLYAAVRVRTLALVHQVLGVLVAGCALSAVVAMTQAVGSPVKWADLVTLPGFDQVSGTGGGGDRLGFRRVVGTASHPIEYGVVLGCCLPLALHLVLHAASRRGRRAAAVGAGLMALALPFALSRGGLVCIATAALVFLLVQPWRVRAATAALGAVALSGAYVLAPSLSSALVRLFANDGTDASITGRTDDYPIVDAAFNAAPWLGGAPLPEDLILDNQWLVLLAQRGLVGVVVFAALLAVPVAGLAASAWRSRTADPVRASLAAALAGALCALAVSGGIFDLMSFGQAAMLLFLLVGISAGVVLPPRPATGPQDRTAQQDRTARRDRSAQDGERARSASTGSPEPAITLPSPRVTERGVSTAP